MGNKKKNVNKKLKSNNPLAQIRADALEELKEKKNVVLTNDEAEDKTPRCLVVKRGKLGRFAKELVPDLRAVMMPYTPNHLKEKKTNTIKDFIHVSGVLGLSHIMTISQTLVGPNLNISRLPRGPSLGFKILRFTPCSFLRKAQHKTTQSKMAFQHPPLVVLNNFENPEHPRHVKMVAVTFQAMFPAINVKIVKLNECRRVLLIDYNEEEDSFSVRHYLVRADPQGASRSVRKLLRSKVPNLGNKSDVSEIIDPSLRFGDGGETSDSEMEDEKAAVSLPQNFPGKGNKAGKKSVVKLREIGPRLKLELVKIQEGVFEGEVQYHKYRTKTEEELVQQRVEISEKRRLAEERRLRQEANVERKKREEEEKLERKRARLEARKLKVASLKNEENSDVTEEDVNNEKEKLPDNRGTKRLKQ